MYIHSSRMIITNRSFNNHYFTVAKKWIKLNKKLTSKTIPTKIADKGMHPWLISLLTLSHVSFLFYFAKAFTTKFFLYLKPVQRFSNLFYRELGLMAVNPILSLSSP